MKTYKILYFQKPKLGGTITGLYDLIAGIDKNMFEPILLFFKKNPYEKQFERLGIKTLILNKNSDHKEYHDKTKRDIAAHLKRYDDTLAYGYKNIKEIYNFLKNDLIFSLRISKILKSEKIDLLHNNNHLPGDRSSVFAGFLSGVPQICHIRTLRKLMIIDKALGKSVNNFIYMSKAIQSVYIKCGIQKELGNVIYDGFNPLEYDKIDTEQIKNLKTEFDIKEDDFIISNIGRIDWWKGHEFFLKALNSVIEVYPSTKALIVGPITESYEGNEYFKKIKQEIETYNISKNIIFTGQRYDIPSIMKMSDLIVHSASEPEPFGRVIVEGMLAEKPVIATSAGGVRDIINNKISGILIPPKDSTAMAKAIKFIIENPEKRKKIAENSHKIARKKFSISQNITNIQKLYKKILDI